MRLKFVGSRMLISFASLQNAKPEWQEANKKYRLGEGRGMGESSTPAQQRSLSLARLLLASYSRLTGEKDTTKQAGGGVDLTYAWPSSPYDPDASKLIAQAMQFRKILMKQ